MANLKPPTGKKAEKAEKTEGNGDDTPKKKRSKFAEMWPEDAALKVLVDSNPKREGSKAAARFEHYFASKTVGEFLAAGGRYSDIAYDLGRQRIEIG